MAKMETKELVTEAILPPVRKKGPLSHYAVVFAPQEDDAKAPQPITKTGTIDDTVTLDTMFGHDVGVARHDYIHAQQLHAPEQNIFKSL